MTFIVILLIVSTATVILFALYQHDRYSRKSVKVICATCAETIYITKYEADTRTHHQCDECREALRRRMKR